MSGNSLLKTACSALRSYQYGNAATDLAKEVADRIDAYLKAGATMKRFLGDGVAAQEPTYEDLRVALAESVKLQSHYAGLLNAWDYGKRVQFKSTDDWIARLRETKTLPASK